MQTNGDSPWTPHIQLINVSILCPSQQQEARKKTTAVEGIWANKEEHLEQVGDKDAGFIRFPLNTLTHGILETKKSPLPSFQHNPPFDKHLQFTHLSFASRHLWQPFEGKETKWQFKESQVTHVPEKKKPKLLDFYLFLSVSSNSKVWKF